jgi:mRNA interferase RelE/StbE
MPPPRPYGLIIHPAAKRDYKQLPRQVRDDVRDSILALRDDPHPAGSAPLAGTRDCFRIRVGKYRVIYEVDDGERLVSIRAVGHRRNVYDLAGRRLGT